MATASQILLSILFRLSRAPATSIAPAFSLCSLSLQHLYCWFLRSKRSRRSVSGSVGSYMEGSDSLYSSYDSVMSDGEFEEEESSSTEEKEEFPTSVSSASISDPVSPLQNTLSTWQAFENWVRKKHNPTTQPISGRRQMSADNIQMMPIEKSDSVLMVEEIIMDELRHEGTDGGNSLNGSQAGFDGARQGGRINGQQCLSSLSRDLGIYLHVPFLHPFFYYLAWCLLIVNILVSTIYTSIKVFRFSSLECYLWLKHLFLAIFCSISIITPSMVLLVTLATTLWSHLQWKAPKLLSTSELHASETVISEIGKASTTYRRIEYLKKYLRPPKEQVLEQFRKLAMKESRVFSLLSYICGYILMLLLLLALSLPQDTKTRYLQRSSINHTFFKTSNPQKWSKSLHSTTELRDWLETDFLDGLFGKRELNEDADCNILLSTGCLLVGKPALRLFKSQDGNRTSEISYERRKLHGYYESYVFEHKLLLLSDKEHDAEEMIEDFVLDLSDMKFRAVSVELLFFNPSSSTLFSVSFLFKVAEVGIVFTSEMLPVKLQDGGVLFYNVNFCLHMVLLFVVLIKIKMLCWHTLKCGVSYFKNGWNLYCAMFDMISAIYLIIYMFYMIHFEVLLSKLKQTRFNSNINIMLVSHLETASQNTLTFLIFLHLIKSLRVLYFHQRLKKLLNRIISSLRNILFIFVLFLIFIIICDILTRNVGASYYSSHPFLNCLKAMQSLLKNYQKPEINNQDHSINKLFSSFILIFIITLHVLLLAVLRTILIKSRSKKSNPHKRISFKDTKKAVKRKLTQYLQKEQPQVINSEDYPLPMEFLLTELEQLTDTLLTKAENLFLDYDTNSEGETTSEDYLILEKEPQIPEPTDINPWNLALESMTQDLAAQVAERLNSTEFKPTKRQPSSLNTSLGSQRKFRNQSRNVSLSASLSNKIRKTYPLCPLDSSLSSLSSSEGVPSGATLRKTKSKGKGKIEDLDVSMVEDSFL